MTTPKNTTRRSFLKTTGSVMAATAVAPIILNAEDKAGSKTPILGKGEFKYEPQHGWGELPRHIVWGDTHGICVDAEGLVYVKHRSTKKEPMDAIVVFDEKGKFVRSFGKEYHGGGHGIDVRKEGKQEFLYLSDVKHGTVTKTDLKGERVWQMARPEEPEIYKDPKKRYSPTNIAFAPDGGFYVGDGYGSSYIHQYDKNAKLVRAWGGYGAEAGKMKTPHGLWLDDRPGRKPSLAVCDRANARLQYFTLDGKHIGFVNELSFPADIDIQGKTMLVPDLHARVSLFDIDNKLIAHLGYDAAWTTEVRKMKMRRQPETWKAGRFIHPHDACFDKAGNIFVAEWVATGRVSFLKKVS